MRKPKCTETLLLIPESDTFSSSLVSFDLFSGVSFTYDEATATYASNTACMRLHLTCILNTPFQANTQAANLQCDYSNWVIGRLSNTYIFFFENRRFSIFFGQWATKIQGLAIGPLKSLFNRLNLR